MKQKMNKSTRQTAGKVFHPVWVTQSIALFVATLVSTVALLVFSGFIVAQGIPHKMFFYISLGAVSLGAFVGGAVSSKLMGGKGLANGAIIGAILALFVYLISLIFSGLEYGTPLYVKIICIVLFGILGGIFGVNFKKRRKI